MPTEMTAPMALDDLATGWLTRRVAQWDSNPGLNNALGSIQIEADPVAFKHPVFPPYSAGNEVTGFTLLNGRNVATTARTVDIRWRAFEVERRAATPDGWELSSRTCLLPDEPGVLVELTVRNAAADERPLELALLLSGRARNTGAEGYNWLVPEIPTGMFSFRESAGLAYTVELAGVPDGLRFINDAGNAFSVQCVWPAPTAWRESRTPVWRETVAAGASLRLCLLCTYHAEQGVAEALAARWRGREAEAFAEARARWEALWAAAFTPDNAIFSGFLPTLKSGPEPMQKLYYNGVLTLLTLRRVYPSCRSIGTETVISTASIPTATVLPNRTSMMSAWCSTPSAKSCRRRSSTKSRLLSGAIWPPRRGPTACRRSGWGWPTACAPTMAGAAASSPGRRSL